jgi:hypothetical protein
MPVRPYHDDTDAPSKPSFDSDPVVKTIVFLIGVMVVALILSYR